MKLLLSNCAVLVALASNAAAEPAWCKPVAGKLMAGNLKDALGNDPRSAIPSIVDILCHATPNTEEANRSREVEAARQRMMKRLAMNEADWNDAAEWASESQGKLMSTSLDYDRKKAWSQLSPIEQFAAISNADDDASYVADAFEPRLTEVGRFAYALWCFGVRRGPVEWAVCEPDLVIDRSKFVDELRASAGSTAYQRTALRLDLDEYADKLREHAAAVKATIAKDAAYQKVFSVAAAGRGTATDTKLADLMRAMDDARITNSRNAYKGCDDKIWPAFQRAVAAIPAKSFVESTHADIAPSPLQHAAGVIVNSPNGYLAAAAFVMCKRSEQEEPDYLVRSLSGALLRWPGYRGPRTSALTSIMNAGIELDDRDSKLDFPTVNRDWFGTDGSSNGGGGGVVASVRKTGGTAVVTFAKKLEQQTECTNRRTTNRIVQILADGHFVYESFCTATKSVTVDVSSKPQTIDARYAQHLTPGMVAWVVEDVLTFAWTKSGAKQPAIVAGVEVK